MNKPTLKDFLEVAFNEDENCFTAHNKLASNRKSESRGQTEKLAGLKTEGGSWIGINPCDTTGTYFKENVTAIRNIVFESDKIPPDEQVRLLKKLNIPFSAVVFSGGISIHVWICLDKPIDLYTFTCYTKLLQQYLLDNQYPVDEKISNPNRFMRLPTAIRCDKEQTLISVKKRINEDDFCLNFINRVCPSYHPPRAVSRGAIVKSDIILSGEKAATYCNEKWPLEAGEKQNALYSWAIYLTANTNLTREEMVKLIFENDRGKHPNEKEYERVVDKALSMLQEPLKL